MARVYTKFILEKLSRKCSTQQWLLYAGVTWIRSRCTYTNSSIAQSAGRCETIWCALAKLHVSQCDMFVRENCTLLAERGSFSSASRCRWPMQRCQVSNGAAAGGRGAAEQDMKAVSFVASFQRIVLHNVLSIPHLRCCVWVTTEHEHAWTVLCVPVTPCILKTMI